MDEHESGWIEITEGERAPTPAGDRVLVGLAAVVLVGGALLAVGFLLDEEADPVVAEASPTPSPSAPPSPSATPKPSATPAPRPMPPPVTELAVDTGRPPPVPFEVEQPGYLGLVYADADLVIRAAPLPDAEQVSVLAAGEAAVIDASPTILDSQAGWAQVIEPVPGGWIMTAEGATTLSDRLAHPLPSGGFVNDLVGGPSEWLALGWHEGDPGRLGRTFGAVSSDGLRWEEIELPARRGWHELTYAWGPLGWLAVGRAHEPGRGLALWVWQSDDARSWTPLGAMRAIAGDRYPIQLVANDEAYVLIESRGWRPPMRLWVSNDGLRWRAGELVDIGADRRLRLVATSLGFYGWTDPTVGPIIAEDRRLDKPQVAAFSPDGERWVSVLGGPGPWNVQLVGVGDELLAFDLDLRGRTRAWRGRIVEGRLPETRTVVWREDRSASASFEHATVTALTSDGQQATAFGWDRQAEVPLSWTHHESGWQAEPLPDGMNAIPRIATAGGGGMVIVGARPTLRADSPIVWHRAPTGAWTPEATPLLEAR